MIISKESISKIIESIGLRIHPLTWSKETERDYDKWNRKTSYTYTYSMKVLHNMTDTDISVVIEKSGDYTSVDITYSLKKVKYLADELAKKFINKGFNHIRCELRNKISKDEIIKQIKDKDIYDTKLKRIKAILDEEETEYN